MNVSVGIIDSNKISRAEGRAEGIEEGMAKGQAKEKMATAKRLLAMGLSPKQIAQGSELPLDEVMKLVK